MKRTLLILSIILSISVTSQGQKAFSGDGGTPVVRFYPNPATSIINFELPNTDNYNIQIFSFLGKKMTELANTNGKTTVNLSDYTRGMYIYQLRDHNGKMIESGKFQVSK